MTMPTIVSDDGKGNITVEGDLTIDGNWQRIKELETENKALKEQLRDVAMTDDGSWLYSCALSEREWLAKTAQLLGEK